MATVRVFAGERIEIAAYDAALAQYYIVNLKQALVYTLCVLFYFFAECALVSTTSSSCHAALVC